MASDSIGLTIPVLVTGAMLALAGVVLFAGRRALAQDLAAVGAPAAPAGGSPLH